MDFVIYCFNKFTKLLTTVHRWDVWEYTHLMDEKNEIAQGHMVTQDLGSEASARALLTDTLRPVKLEEQLRREAHTLLGSVSPLTSCLTWKSCPACQRSSYWWREASVRWQGEVLVPCLQGVLCQWPLYSCATSVHISNILFPGL